MFTRKSIFALAALVALGTSALVPTSASAFGRGGGGGFGGGHFGGGHFGMGGGHFGFNRGFGGGRVGFNRVAFHPIFRGPIFHPILHPIRGYGPRHHWPIWWARFHHRHFWGGYGYAGVAGAGIVAADGAASPAEPAANCNCLTKQYLQDGSVVFKDLCTKEEAMATPDELQAQAQGSQQQAPTTR